MSFFSEERASELRDLFFESAAELLQNLNEEGLELEKRPQDEEIIRQVRRTVHTLKGDSAACGYQELSALAHELEDVLGREMAASSNGSLADVVLIAADTFSSMLSAYRDNMQPPAGDELRRHILSLTQQPSKPAPRRLQGRFSWTEYEQAEIADALSKGEAVYNVAFAIDPQCPMRGAAIQVIRHAVQDCGRLLAIFPDQSTLTENLDVVEASLSSQHAATWIEKRCSIPSVTSQVLVQRVHVPDNADADDVLEISLQSVVPQEVAAAPASQPSEPQTSISSGNTETLLRVDAERIDALLNLVGELIIGKSMLHQCIGEFDKRFSKDPLRGKFADAMAFQSRILNDLQKSVMKVRMVPVEQLFRRFPRVVRDIAKSCGKSVNLVVSGEDTDLDKSILDMLAEPLAHLVRNAVDHGIESSDERAAAGKPSQGTIRLNAYHQGNQIVIEVNDDGRGIDANKLVARALELGLLSPADKATLSEAEALDLVFHPGLSTAAQVTSISGRGVGMDVVKNVLERLKGTVSIKTAPGAGTTFYLRVPLTLAIINALLFRVANQVYAVPLASVVEINRIHEKDIHRVDNHDVIQLRGEVLTLVHLGGLGKHSADRQRMFVVVISLGERKFGLIVDHLEGEEELVIKALDDHLVATDLVSGASILGDGSVVLILNLAGVVAKLGRSQRTLMEATA